jgi:hypothetical protein
MPKKWYQNIKNCQYFPISKIDFKIQKLQQKITKQFKQLLELENNKILDHLFDL